ncbi:hypothetical protein AB0C42_24100 [Micromonospora taraxaci]|uniref:hypothetical protein n=1 Tax=Micromonospora taraxaci TaxID=1316803 RepID=UPI0033E67D2C
MAILSGQRLPPTRLNTRTVRIRRTTTLSLATGTITPITFDLEDFDNAAMFSPPAAVLTLPVAGLWGFLAYGGIASNATGHRRLLVELGPTGSYPTIDQRPAVSGDDTHITLSGSHSASSPGEQLRLAAQQNSGGALLLRAGAYFTAWLIES